MTEQDTNSDKLGKWPVNQQQIVQKADNAASDPALTEILQNLQIRDEKAQGRFGSNYGVSAKLKEIINRKAPGTAP